MTTQNHRDGQRWTASEDRAITSPGAMGRLAEIAASLGRTTQAARDRRHHLAKRWGSGRCGNPEHEEWSAAEDGLLQALTVLYPRRLPAGAVDALAVLFLGRTPGAVIARLSMMRRNHEQ